MRLLAERFVFRSDDLGFSERESLKDMCPILNPPGGGGGKKITSDYLNQIKNPIFTPASWSACR